MALVNPHGKEKKLKPLLLAGEELREAKRQAQSLPGIRMTSRETSDLIMLGIGAFTPLDGFMGQQDWKGVCESFQMADGTFWPIPITFSTRTDEAASLKEGQEIALVDDETGELMGSMTVREKYSIDKHFECRQIFRTTDPAHPGVEKVMSQGDVNLAGPVKVFSEGEYPEKYKGIYLRPAETR
ncbi:MAG: sulfate adenylyltransferase, partial [Acidobacteria bacterium]|nr:sulfate adenylyltransferase [Acidobacteriota bacterium]